MKQLLKTLLKALMKLKPNELLQTFNCVTNAF